MPSLRTGLSAYGLFENRRIFVKFYGFNPDKMQTNVRISGKSWQKELDKRQRCAIIWVRSRKAGASGYGRTEKRRGTEVIGGRKSSEDGSRRRTKIVGGRKASEDGSRRRAKGVGGRKSSEDGSRQRGRIRGGLSDTVGTVRRFFGKTEVKG